MTRYLCTPALFFGLVLGCGHSGQQFDANTARSIEVGATKDSVLGKLGGPPGATSPVAADSALQEKGCKELLTWSFAEYKRGVMYTKGVTVPIGEDGLVCAQPSVIEADSK